MALQRLVVGLFVIATVTAIRSHADYPFRRSSIAAVAYFACTLLYWWAYRWALYFTDPPGPNEPPFFEDGMIVEGFIYPVIYLLVYIPVVVAFTLVLAAAIVAVTNILVNCKSPTASTPLARHNPSEH
jgi:hypothetical protein